MNLQDIVPDDCIAVEYHEKRSDVLVSKVLAIGINICDENFAVGDFAMCYYSDGEVLKDKSAIIVNASKVVKYFS